MSHIAYFQLLVLSNPQQYAPWLSAVFADKWMYFSLSLFFFVLFPLFYVRRTIIHKWHVSFDYLHQKKKNKTSGDTSKLLHLTKYFQVWIDSFIKGCFGSCRSVSLCSRFCLFTCTKTDKPYLYSRMNFYLHTYQYTCDPDQDSEHLLSLRKLRCSPFLSKNPQR